MYVKSTYTGTYRKVITFFYPHATMLDMMAKETAYRVKMLLDAGENVPEGAVFHIQDDAEWLSQEAPKAIAKIAQPYVRLQYGLTGGDAVFEDATITSGTTDYDSAGFIINDYERYVASLPDWFDRTIEKMYLYELCVRWFMEKNNQAAVQYYSLEMAQLMAQAVNRANEFFKRKASQNVYAPANRTIYAGYFAESPELGELVPENMDVNATLQNGKITAEYPVGQVGYPVLMVPESMATFLSWYMSPSNYGPIGGDEGPAPNNLFPDPIDVLLDGDVNYKAYVANYATTIARSMTFLTTAIE